MSRPGLAVVVYSRRGCHLCEDAESLLRQEQGRFRFRLEVVTVDDDPELVRRLDACAGGDGDRAGALPRPR